MPSVNDWAFHAAEYIVSEGKSQGRARVERVAAIIATFADPIVKLLQESKRMHSHNDAGGSPYFCCPQCACKSWIGSERIPADTDEYPPNYGEKPCNCGADAWNARVDQALDGKPL